MTKSAAVTSAGAANNHPICSSFGMARQIDGKGVVRPYAHHQITLTRPMTAIGSAARCLRA